MMFLSAEFSARKTASNIEVQGDDRNLSMYLWDLLSERRPKNNRVHHPLWRNPPTAIHQRRVRNLLITSSFEFCNLEQLLRYVSTVYKSGAKRHKLIKPFCFCFIFLQNSMLVWLCIHTGRTSDVHQHIKLFFICKRVCLSGCAYQ